MNFDYPEILFALLLLPPLAVLALVRFSRRRKLFSLIAGNPALGTLGVRAFFSALFFLLFLTSLIIALAEPRWGIRLIPEFHRGAEVVLALDLSRSMEVQDMDSGDGGASRLGRALFLARTLVNNGGGIHFGVVIGKGMGVLAIPLTQDTEAVLDFLEGLSGAAISGRGTNLEALVAAASSAFTGTFPARRRIVLFSDGEALRGSLPVAVEKAAERDILITVVGLGTETGGMVPAGPEPGEEEPEIRSVLRGEVLRNAALRGGGSYIDGGGDTAAARLIEEAVGAAGSTAGSFKQEIKYQGYLFILAALAFLGLSKLFERRWRRGLS
jgi:Ca-activated chloride channel family protein